MTRGKRITAVACVGVLVGSALSQFGAQQGSTNSYYKKPNSYSDYYHQQLQHYQRPTVDPRNYTIDKYYYHRPTISPYLNLTRPQNPNAVNNYFRYVKPELNRRSQAVAPQPTPRRMSPTSPNNNPYFNRYYNLGPGKSF